MEIEDGKRSEIQSLRTLSWKGCRWKLSRLWTNVPTVTVLILLRKRPRCLFIWYSFIFPLPRISLFLERLWTRSYKNFAISTIHNNIVEIIQPSIVCWYYLCDILKKISKYTRIITPSIYEALNSSKFLGRSRYKQVECDFYIRIGTCIKLVAEIHKKRLRSRKGGRSGIVCKPCCPSGTL